MSKLVHAWQRVSDAEVGKSEELELMRTECPNFCDVLLGVRNPDTGGWDLPPCTVMFFIEGGVLKFCLSPSIGDRVAFGVIKDPVNVQASLENALANEEYGWKPSKRRNRS